MKAYVEKRGRSHLHVHVSSTSSCSEVRNLLSLKSQTVVLDAAHPQSCVWMSKEFCYHHHTHGQGRPRSPIRQRQCNYNCLQNTRQRLLPVLDIPRAALATTSDAILCIPTACKTISLFCWEHDGLLRHGGLQKETFWIVIDEFRNMYTKKFIDALMTMHKLDNDITTSNHLGIPRPCCKM